MDSIMIVNTKISKLNWVVYDFIYFAYIYKIGLGLTAKSE